MNFVRSTLLLKCSKLRKKYIHTRNTINTLTHIHNWGMKMVHFIRHCDMKCIVNHRKSNYNNNEMSSFIPIQIM